MATYHYESSLFLRSSGNNPTANAQSNANALYDVFSQCDNRFSHTVDDNYLVFDNKFRIELTQSSNNIRLNCTKLDGTVILAKDSGLAYDSERYVNIYITPYLFYCYFTKNGSKESNLFIYSKGDDYYYGVGNTNGSLPDSLTDIVNINSLPASATYSIQKISQKALSSYVMFSSNCLLVADGGTFTVLDTLKSCSNVPALSTISVNNVNYLAIGTNTLIEAPTS